MEHKVRMKEEEIACIYRQPLLALVRQAAEVHREHWRDDDIELCALLSIKTGNCPNDCAYCSQSRHHPTSIESHELMALADVVAFAEKAHAKNIRRVCLSAAWSQPPGRELFGRVVEIIRAVKKIGIEVCATLGKLSPAQAEELRVAGLNYYNHNIDTSPEHYAKIVTTRRFEDRLATIGHLRGTGIHLCCGGIIGMGESHRDRMRMLAHLATMDPVPSSVPINMLVKIPGTPLADLPDLDPLEAVRVIAVARIVLPHARIRLSAGRAGMSRETQAMAFVAGVNSIFVGDKLLTTPLPGEDFDSRLLADLLQPCSW